MTQPSAPIDHYENFPVASWLCPAALRPHVAAIYHFARTADDLADEGQATPAERLVSLARYRAALDRLYTPDADLRLDPVIPTQSLSPVKAVGEIQASATLQALDFRLRGNDGETELHTVSIHDRSTMNGNLHILPIIKTGIDEDAWPHIFTPLHRSIQAVHLPHQPLADLLTAFEQDVADTRDARIPADREALLAYCRHSANPVGRLMLHLYGVHDRDALAQSDAICSALQLINFWQDLSQDIPRGRHYIPLADRVRFGLADEAITACQPSPAVGAFVADACAWTRALMQSGAPLVHRVPGRAGWELRAIVQGGLRMLDHVESLGAQAIAQRRKLAKADWIRVAWRVLRM